LERVYSAPLISLSELLKSIINRGYRSRTIRVQYSTLSEYLNIADHLKIMRDFKDGVPRTAYLGVVTCFVYGVRIYIAPNPSSWEKYDPKWEALPSANDVITFL
uniref:Alpha-1,3-mannosyl-glycoprotein 2-beta-N-acetylglucosaminyltransferase n=1 Tax=Gongylonema pulchrum TaxID=637853 RepID=A0A183ETF3_9BILA